MSKKVGTTASEVGTFAQEVGTLSEEVGTLDKKVGTKTQEVGPKMTVGNRILNVFNKDDDLKAFNEDFSVKCADFIALYTASIFI